MIGFKSIEEIKQMLKSRDYIVMSPELDPNDGFFVYMENKYFTPSTPRNEEFNVIMGQAQVKGDLKFFALFIIDKTEENKDAIYNSLIEYYKKPLDRGEFEHRLKMMEHITVTSVAEWFSFDKVKRR